MPTKQTTAWTESCIATSC